MHIMLKNKIAFLINRIKKLHGDPHYVVFGMAIGVFIAITPTTPFHTVVAITLSLFFEDSVNALEAIKILIIHLESEIELSQKINYFVDFIQTNIKTFMIMNFGGILLGLPASLVAYFITKGFFVTMLQKKIANKKAVEK